jgi:hypothetical protein
VSKAPEAEISRAMDETFSVFCALNSSSIAEAQQLLQSIKDAELSDAIDAKERTNMHHELLNVGYFKARSLFIELVGSEPGPSEIQAAPAPSLEAMMMMQAYLGDTTHGGVADHPHQHAEEEDDLISQLLAQMNHMQGNDPAAVLEMAHLLSQIDPSRSCGSTRRKLSAHSLSLSLSVWSDSHRPRSLPRQHHTS